jgi:hypothetical protein
MGLCLRAEPLGSPNLAKAPLSDVVKHVYSLENTRNLQLRRSNLDEPTSEEQSEQ